MVSVPQLVGAGLDLLRARSSRARKAAGSGRLGRSSHFGRWTVRAVPHWAL